MQIFQDKTFTRFQIMLLALLLVGAVLLLMQANSVIAQLVNHPFFQPETWLNDLTSGQGGRPNVN